MEKKQIEALKKEIEVKYIEITNKINLGQQQLKEMMSEKVKLEGEYRLIEKLEKSEIKEK